jgi:hypothetical protein
MLSVELRDATRDESGWRESNPHHQLGRLRFWPLNYIDR